MKNVVAFGEVLMRLKSPGRERLFQSPVLEATFGGSEVNVAASLAILGEKARLISAVPGNPIGHAAVTKMKSFGIDTSLVITKPGRLGIYFFENGANQKPSSVTYDREGSSLCNCSEEDMQWDLIFSDARWFHVSGITPALSASTAALTLKAVRAARDLKIPVSVDLNFRKKLWNYGKPATEIMPEIVRHCDVLIANEEDIQLALGIKTGGESGASTADAYYSLCRMTNTVFPNLRAIAVTLRENESADINKWSAILFNGNEQHHSTQYRIADVVDRVGVGDSFAAGLIYGMLNFSSNREILEFATAASCLKHSIPGDINLSTKEEIRSLAKGNSTGRISR